MATQRLLLVKIVGESGRVVADRCRAWQRHQQDNPDDPELARQVGRFADTLDEHRAELPVVYFVEWLDRWLGGIDYSDRFTTRGGVTPNCAGRFTDVYCIDRPTELLTLPADGWQHDEQAWLASRLREAAAAWGSLVPGGTLVLLRQATDVSTDDEEITAAMSSVPDWLTG
jgi:hypothetical protein